MADLDLTSGIGTTGRDQCILVLNGHTINYNANGNFMGAQRAGKHIIGQGTINLTNPNGNKGSYAIFNAQSHGYDGVQNKQTIGADVIINAPNFYVISDWDGSYNNGYPWIRIFGKINVYALANVGQGNRSPRVEIFENADVTINASRLYNDTTSNYMNSQQLQLTIYGGTFTLPKEANSFGFWTNDIYDANVHTTDKVNGVTVANADKILVYGGTFNVKLPDIVLGAQGYAIEYDEATGVSTVVTKACTGAHNFQIAEAFEGAERTCVIDGVHYLRCECGAYAVQPVDMLGHSYTIIDIEIEATPFENGVKRITCDRCGDNYTFTYATSPLEAEVTVTVLTADGEKEITLLAGDLFEMVTEETINGVLTTISAIKSFDGYTKNDIVKIQIPAGSITVLEGVFKDMSALKEIVLLARAEVTFVTSAFDNCQALESLTLGENSKAIFGKKVVNNCPNFATLDLRLGDAVFEAYSFELNAAIKEILMASGRKYEFGERALRECGITELIFPDNSIISWGTASFAECQYLEYIYFGSNIGVKKVADDAATFDGISRLKTVIVMDLTYFGKWAFSGKEMGKTYGPLSDMTLYCHSEALTIHGNAFNNKNGDYHVYLYVVNPSLTSVSYTNCNITVYNGIAHGYVEDVIVPSTCVTNGVGGFKTDCPCGIDYREVAYKTYSSFDTSLNDVEHEPFGTETYELPLKEEHTLSEIIKDIDFKNGMTEMGTRVYKCLYCDEASGEESEPTFAAIFKYYGYSVSTYGKLSVMQSYGINKAVYADYVELTGKTVSYGVAAALKINAESGELVGVDGKALSDKIIAHNCVNAKYDVYDIRITGLDNYRDTELYLCGYYISNGEVYYIDNGKSGLELPE